MIDGRSILRRWPRSGCGGTQHAAFSFLRDAIEDRCFGAILLGQGRLTIT
ncbi:hypothetical protein M2202_003995 [Bradyrhizobium japonicum]|uniref:Transposase n=1 Tax=Bradyrhizobium japonicum TaxID=375 RepID=A0ABV2S114_BRAJP|nr:hypothetical protein [Bradyrhizobium japonicum]MCP1789333.1 hypothetical protein [Bradyrhizobium japonicum]MCP1801832.1 hypothetical protein [Bradyrhizobium japonicum]MCP1820143.1 hypothetical protein [Bradyrhizobium japonicum]MCP1868349.1 hypothetical protein [Bradyrhizobium japonicum]